MFNGSNCDRKSQFSGILTEPLNPRAQGPELQKQVSPGTSTKKTGQHRVQTTTTRLAHGPELLKTG